MNSLIQINDNCKPSSKVLRPPGGGSSDIFGVALPQTPRGGAKNHMQSHIFAAEKNGSAKNNGDQTRRGQKNVDSYSRLFGEPNRPMTPAKNHMKSSIPFGMDAAEHLLINGNGLHHPVEKSGSASSTSSSVSSSTENLKMNGVYRTDGNPVTGEGYKSADMNSSIPSLNGTKEVINKNRIPPGGYSSGLW